MKPYDDAAPDCVYAIVYRPSGAWDILNRFLSHGSHRGLLSYARRLAGSRRPSAAGSGGRMYKLQGTAQSRPDAAGCTANCTTRTPRLR
ncbi:MAG: hypothetical protein ACRD2B_00240 [Terriglobia bacterium]